MYEQPPASNNNNNNNQEAFYGSPQGGHVAEQPNGHYNYHSQVCSMFLGEFATFTHTRKMSVLYNNALNERFVYPHPEGY